MSTIQFTKKLKKSVNIIFWLLLLSFSTLLVSCSGSKQPFGSKKTINFTQSAFGQNGSQGALSLFLTDFPIQNKNVLEVNVNINHIEVYSQTAAAWQTVVDYGSNGRVFDLLTLQNGNTAELGSMSLEPGQYNQLRLYLNDSSTIKVANGKTPQILPLKIPSGTQTGIKLNRTFTVNRQGYTTLIVDFNAQKSVSYNKGQGYMLKPVVSVLDAKTAAGAAQTITAAKGGSVSIMNEVSIDIPAGALSTDTQVEILPIGVSMPKTLSSIKMLSKRYEFLPDGSKFNSDVTVTMHYDPVEVASLNIDEKALGVYYFDYNENSWISVGGVVDLAAKTVTAKTNHFTPFGVGGPSPTGGPTINPARIVYTTDPVFAVLTQVPDNITATIKDTDGVASGAIYYRKAGAAVYESCILVINATNKYTCLIPAAYVTGDITSQTFEVYAVATDTLGNTTVVPGTAPGTPHTYTYNPDVDADGMNDRWEALYGINPGDPTDGAADLDGDGLTNLVEYQGGTNPAGFDATVSGNISGLVAGDTIVLQNNNTDNLSVTGNGSGNDAFTFPARVFNGAAYSVSVLTQPVGKSCTVSSGSGVISGAHIVNVAVACVISNPYKQIITTLPDHLKKARKDLSATTLLDGRVLITGGRSGMFDAAIGEAEIFDPATNSFSSGILMNVPRSRNTATRLQDGRVLIAGGFYQNSPIKDAEVYDPATNTFTAVGSLNVARYMHSAVLLNNGKVLIVGGFNGNKVREAELFDPATNSFSVVAFMTYGRFGQAASLLADGRVLVAGGLTTQAEIFDPSTNSFTVTGLMHFYLSGHTATLLNDGRVLIVGAQGAETFDPATNTFSIAAYMSTSRSSHSATKLNDGRVLIAGGFSQTTAEVFDPASNSFSAPISLNGPRSHHGAVLLQNGRVLLMGGLDSSGVSSLALSSAEVFDPVSMTFSPLLHDVSNSYQVVTVLKDKRVLLMDYNRSTGAIFNPETLTYTPVSGMNTKRLSSFTATNLSDGRVLIAGGRTSPYNSIPTNSAEVFDPATGVYTLVGNLVSARLHHRAVLLKDGRVLISGGMDDAFVRLNTAEIFDPVSNTFSLTGSMSAPRLEHSMTMLNDGRVLVTGGNDYINFCEIYDPASSSFLQIPGLKYPRSDHETILLPNGKVFISGGLYGGRIVMISEIYDPVTNHFYGSGISGQLRIYHTLTLLSDGRVLIAGGYDFLQPNGYLALTEIYDPATGIISTGPYLNNEHYFGTSVRLNDGRVMIMFGGNDSVEYFE